LLGEAEEKRGFYLLFKCKPFSSSNTQYKSVVLNYKFELIHKVKRWNKRLFYIIYIITINFGKPGKRKENKGISGCIIMQIMLHSFGRVGRSVKARKEKEASKIQKILRHDKTGFYLCGITSKNKKSTILAK